MEKRSWRNNNKIKKILEVAISLFLEDGYHNVSIEEIVQTADSSTGSFYNYFGSKDELIVSYRQQILESCQKFYDRLKSDPYYINSNALEKLQAFTEHVLALLSEVGEEFGRVFIVYRLKETNATPEDKPYYPIIMDLIEKGQNDRSIRNDYSVRNIADIIDFFVIGFHINWLINRGAYIPADKKTSIINILFDNISNTDVAHKPKWINYEGLWADAASRTSRDFSSDIKRLEEQWLERLYSSKPY